METSDTDEKICRKRNTNTEERGPRVSDWVLLVCGLLGPPGCLLNA